MPAVLALTGEDYKRHSGVIARFSEQYLKIKLFPATDAFVVDVLERIVKIIGRAFAKRYSTKESRCVVNPISIIDLCGFDPIKCCDYLFAILLFKSEERAADETRLWILLVCFSSGLLFCHLIKNINRPSCQNRMDD